jgi:hypothetical protein
VILRTKDAPPIFDRLRGLTESSHCDVPPRASSFVTPLDQRQPLGVEPDDTTSLPYTARGPISLRGLQGATGIHARARIERRRIQNGDVKVGPITPSYTSVDGLMFSARTAPRVLVVHCVAMRKSTVDGVA